MTARAITKSLTLGVPNSGCPIFLSPAPASIAITVHRNITISDDGTPVTVASEKNYSVRKEQKKISSRIITSIARGRKKRYPKPQNETISLTVQRKVGHYSLGYIVGHYSSIRVPLNKNYAWHFLTLTEVERETHTKILVKIRYNEVQWTVTNKNKHDNIS